MCIRDRFGTFPNDNPEDWVDLGYLVHVPTDSWVPDGDLAMLIGYGEFVARSYELDNGTNLKPDHLAEAIIEAERKQAEQRERAADITF